MKWQWGVVEGFSFPSPGTSSPRGGGAWAGLGMFRIVCKGWSKKTVSKILERSCLSET